MKHLSLQATFAAAASLVACGPRAGDVGETGRPIVFMLSPAHAPADPAALSELGAALARDTGLKVRVEVAPTPERAIEAFGSAKADLGLLSPTEYLFARAEYRVQPRLQVVRDRQSHGFVAEILVKGDSGIEAITDLAGKKIAYSDPLSTSGFLLPAATLAKAGVKAEPVFTGSRERALAALEAGEVSAATSYHSDELIASGLKVLATSERIPNEPIFVRADLDASKADALIAALVKLAERPEGRALLHDFADIDGLRPITDAAYDQLRATVKDAGLSVADLVPSGRTISWSNNAILGPE